MKISKKLSGGFGTILILIILVAAAAIYGFTAVAGRIAEIHSTSIPLLVGTNAQSTAALEAHALQKEFLYAETVESRNTFREDTLGKLTTITDLITTEEKLLNSLPQTAQTAAFLTQATQIKKSIAEYGENIQLLSEKLNEKNKLEDSMQQRLKKIESVISMFISDKNYTIKDSITIIDALKEVYIAQLHIRLILGQTMARPELHLDTPKKISQYDTIIMEQTDRLLNLISDEKAMSEVTALSEELKEFTVTIGKYFKNEENAGKETARVQQRIRLKVAIKKMQNRIDNKLESISQNWSEVKSTNTAIINQLSSINDDLPRIAKAVSTYLQKRDDKSFKRISKVIGELHKSAEKLKADCVTTIDSTTAQTIIKNIDAYGQNTLDWLKLKLDIEENSTRRLDTITSQVMELLGTKVKNVESAASLAVADILSYTETSLTIVYAATAAAIILGIIISILLVTNITRPIRKMTLRLENLSGAQDGLVSFMEQNLARGDWSEFCEVEISASELEILEQMSARRDEIGQMSREGARMTGSFRKCLEATNTVIQQVNYILNKVSSTVTEVAGNSEHLETQSRELAEGATRQAANLEEISSALQDMSGKVDQNARDASEASGLSSEANTSGSAGTQRMNELVTKMQQINSATGEITKIIKTIDDIAFQTNLLALNAAVEAARAGSHGKGFAVVAEEVRNLAARSAKAAGETGTLIDNVVNEINSGNEMAGNTAKVLAEIIGYSEKVTTLSNEVAAASTEQAAGITQINKALLEVDDITQHNAANAEETASSSQLLNHHASTLQQLTENFILMTAESNENLDETYLDEDDSEWAEDDTATDTLAALPQNRDNIMLEYNETDDSRE